MDHHSTLRLSKRLRLPGRRVQKETIIVPRKPVIERVRTRLNPTFLLVATSNWMPTARLGIALSRTGSYLDAVCPVNHLIRRSNVLRQVHEYKALSPLSSFRVGISVSNPDLIISADDLSTQHLIDLHAQEKQNGSSGRAICDLIERSLGPAESFPAMTTRAAFMNIARDEGIVVPRTAVIKDQDDLEKWTAQTGFPIVLKLDGSSSGEGTGIARTFPEAQRICRFLENSPQLLRVIKRAIVNRDLRSVRRKLLRRLGVVNAQEYIKGRDATSLVACWKGEVLAALHFEVLEKQYDLGPASVMRLITNLEIETAVAKIVKRLKLSGLHGFDFLLQEQSNVPYMIEFNPRATQVGHLTLGPGRDLPGALAAAVSGERVRGPLKLTDNPVIALFPQESMRDPQSSFLQSGYHDVPQGESELVSACLRQAHPGAAQTFIRACSRILYPNQR
jgi:hypothetical protein